MPRKPSRMDRVLKVARTYRGVCQADFLGPDVIDGGSPITRVAARIEDLESKRGLTFEIIGWRDRCKVYRLSDTERDSTPDPLPGKDRPASPQGPAVSAVSLSAESTLTGASSELSNLPEGESPVSAEPLALFEAEHKPGNAIWDEAA